MTNRYNIYNNVVRRIASEIIDVCVFTPIIIVGIYISSDLEGIYIYLADFLFLSLPLSFYAVFMHYRFGQTLGKMAMGIKVVDLTETRGISIKQAILRRSIYILFDIAGLIYYPVTSFIYGKPTTKMIETFDHFYLIIFFIVIILELIVLFSNKRQRALHDYIAKSVVIRVKN